MMQPLVTIGIPTYNRPELLKRALTCVAVQDYANLEVLVADNCTPGHDVQNIVNSFKGRISNLTFIQRHENIGPLQNFITLIDEASGEYFMWLADDDEISSNYVSALVSLLEKNPDASSAAGHWVLMLDQSGSKKLMPTAYFPQRLAITRAISFAWDADDAFFYGLHRVSAIRKASFPGYWWPNKQVLLNWAYVFLFDMVLNGKVLMPSDPTVQFINHDYTIKNYGEKTPPFLALFQYFIRRLNVHFFFLTKTAKSINPLAVIPMALVSVAALSREFTMALLGSLWRRTKQVVKGSE